jgi:putative CocE/NonD family hydrolase
MAFLNASDRAPASSVRRTLVRLIVLCCLLSRGAAAAAQEHGPYRVIREFNVPVVMTDGVTLMADVYRPDTPAKVPALLLRTPYMRTASTYYDAGEYWASFGYAYVVQDVRGRGDSQGEFEPLVNEGRDGFDTQSWVAKQPWCTGEAGTLGGSYAGWTQVFPAILNNPALKAMIPMVTPSDPGGFWPMRHGAVSFGVLEWIMLVQGRTNRALPDSQPQIMAAYATLPLQAIDEKIGARARLWQDYLANLHSAAYWLPRSYQDELPKSRVPMFHVTGWYDGTLGGSLENFANMRAKASAEAKNAQYLLVGPWRHWVDADSRGTRLGAVDMGSGSLVDVHRLYRLWFDHYLKHDSNAVASWPHVRLFVLGGNRWIGADDWPIAGTRFVRVYARGGRAGQPGAGVLSGDPPPATDAPDRYDYDPADPTPFLWSVNLDSGGPDDYRPVEERKDVLVYTMASPERTLTVCGPVRATIVAGSSAKDADWIARLTLVHRDGYSQRLTEGWVRARARHGDFRDEPLTPGQVETYQLDLWGTCVAVQPGERLRLSLMSGAFPLVDRNLGTAGSIAAETRGVVAHQEILHAGTRATFVTLPILDHPVEIGTP